MSPSQPAYYIEDRRISSHPQMSASHLLGLQGPQQTPAVSDMLFARNAQCVFLDNSMLVS